MGDEEGPEFTPEEVAKGKQVTEYYEALSENPGPIPPDETKTHNIRDIINGKQTSIKDEE